MFKDLTNDHLRLWHVHVNAMCFDAMIYNIILRYTILYSVIFQGFAVSALFDDVILHSFVCTVIYYMLYYDHFDSAFGRSSCRHVGPIV